MEDIINYVDDQVQVIFEKNLGTQNYRDALWFSQAEYTTTSKETVEIMKQQRFDNWLAIVNALPTEVPQE